MWPALVWLNRALFVTVEIIAFAQKQAQKALEPDSDFEGSKEDEEQQDETSPEEVLEKQKEDEKKEWDIVGSGSGSTDSAASSEGSESEKQEDPRAWDIVSPNPPF